MITTREIPEKIKALEPFKCYAVMGLMGLRCVGVKKQNFNYVVYSYLTPILELTSKGELVFFNNLYYSKTTSEIQNVIAEMFKLPQHRNKKVYLKKDLK